MVNRDKIEFNLEVGEDDVMFLQYRKSYAGSRMPKWLLSIFEFFNYWRTPKIFVPVEIKWDTDYDDCRQPITFKSTDEYIDWFNEHRFAYFGDFYEHYWNDNVINEYFTWVEQWRIKVGYNLR